MGGTGPSITLKEPTEQTEEVPLPHGEKAAHALRTGLPTQMPREPERSWKCVKQLVGLGKVECVCLLSRSGHWRMVARSYMIFPFLK